MDQLNLSQTAQAEKRKQRSIVSTQKRAMASKKWKNNRTSEKEKLFSDISDDTEISFTPSLCDHIQPDVDTNANGEDMNELENPGDQACDHQSSVDGRQPNNHLNHQLPHATNNDDDDEIAVVDLETIEATFAENIHHQTERLFDLVEDIERANNAKWSNVEDCSTGLAELKMFIEKFNRVRRNTIDLPEFQERLSMRHQPGYQYIDRILNALRAAKTQIETAKGIVFQLPDSTPNYATNNLQSRTVFTQPSDSSSILEEARQSLRARGQALDERVKNAARYKGVQQINTQQQDVTDLYTQKAPNSRGKQKPMSSGLPRHTSKDDFQRPKSRHHEQSHSSQAFLWSNPSVPPKTSRSFRPKEHLDFDFGFPGGRNPSPPLDDEWIEVQTKRHPQIGKPRHYGKIMSFKNLFMNSFQRDKVYNPDAVGCYYNSNINNINITPFDGENIESYQMFEQVILMKAVNNITMDWDEKFYTLLTSTIGVAQSTVQGYTGELTLQNFVQAIEDLYHSFGQPRKYRNVLINKLINREFIDLRKKSSLSRVSLIITRLLNSFEDNNAFKAFIPHGFICESIKMTEEARASYRLFCMVRKTEKDLQSLNDWLTYTITDWF